jgi:hypothetical protein
MSRRKIQTVEDGIIKLIENFVLLSQSPALDALQQIGAAAQAETYRKLLCSMTEEEQQMPLVVGRKP